MKFIKKLLFWTTLCTGIFLILALLISLLLSRIISPEDLKTKIVEQVSSRIGYKINVHSIDLMIFPTIHAELRNVTISESGNFSVNINSVKAYPRLRPLLAGNVNIYKLYLGVPNIEIYIPEKLSEETDLLKEVTFRNIEKKLYDFYKSRAVEKTDIIVQIRSGKLALYAGKRPYITFSRILARVNLKPDKIKIALDAKSNICDRIAIDSQYFSENSNGKADINLYNLNPKLLFDYFYPDSVLKISDSRANFKVNLSKKGVLNLNSEFEGDIPFLSFKRNNKKLTLNSRYFSGNLNIYGDRTAVNIKKLVVNNTESILSGNYVVAAPPFPLQLDMEGKNIDIKKTGKIALFLTGNSQTFQSIFNVLKEGQVPSINITAKAQQASGLGDIKNIFIRGKALNTRISVPKPSLELENVKGDVTVSNGILEANNAAGRLGNSIAQNGTLKLGLPEDNDLFYLDAFVHADVTKLPSILKQVVSNESFLKELSFIKQCEGKAEGKLTIDNKAGSCSTKVDVSKFDIKGVYTRFSNPIAVIGNKFFLDDSVVKFIVVNAISGKSSVSNLSAGFRFDKDYSFNILSGKTIIDSNEINHFILPLQSIQNPAEQLNTKGGTVTLNDIELNGPLFFPAKWRLKTAGKIENMLVDYKSFFKQVINITNLKFNAYQNKSSLSLKFMDAVLRNTIISNLSVEFGLEKDYPFKIQSEKAIIDAKELNLLTPYFQFTKNFSQNVSINKGTAILSNTSIKGPLFTPDKWRLTTAGKVENMLVDYKSVFTEPLDISALNFNVYQNQTDKGIRQNKYKIEYGYITSGKSHITINGDIDLSKEELRLDMSAFSESLYWSDIKKLINQSDIKSNDNKTEKFRSSAVKGIIRTHIDNFIYDDYTLSPFQADVLLKRDKIDIAILKADICGISLTGNLESFQSKAEFKIKPFAKDQELASSLKCFWNDMHLATGVFNLDGKIYSQGEEKEISKLLYGSLEFNAKKGRIYRLGVLSKIFALLNVTEIFRGKLPDLIGEGFAYNTIIIDGKLEKGDFVVSKFIIDGASMAIVCTGDIDISNNNADLIVLISPFKTVDLIIKYIPVVNQILGGNIITIPFRVLGKLEDPDVIPLSPKAVGSGLLNMLQRTISLPVKIIQPITSGKDMLYKK